jgi:UDP-N-acetylmuramoyl-L-alanyl-D-glutamate--2,6-diaminopimelate ligase
METISLQDILSQLNIPLEISGDPAGVMVGGITFDSRNVKPGDIFVALVGGNADGHRFIPGALDNGAVAVLGSQPMEKRLPVPYVLVDEPRLAMAHIAAAMHGFPARKMVMIGVTGTDGKTTTSSILYHILRAAGLKAGLISTVSAVIGDRELDTGFHVTTPEAPDVQRYLKQMADEGITHVVLETTSHGLAQYRVAACEFDIAVVTNITHEHLDYHGSYEAYREAKARLFTGLKDTVQKQQGNVRLAIINRDDQSYEYLKLVSTGHCVSYGITAVADVLATDIQHNASGIDFKVDVDGVRSVVHTNLVGDYNVSNCLAAIAVATKGVGIQLEKSCRAIADFSGVPGRMERIDLGQNFTAIVDFAHTPNALKVALETARKMTSQKILAVFGSAGLRDREKRRMMAEVSADLADITILTAEDPRTESLDEILAEMAGAVRKKGGLEGDTFFCVPDRGNAIRKAVQMAQPGDLVIACGKGHEQSMCFGTVEYLWDDRVAMRAALCDHLKIPGPLMPYLPTRDA